MDEIIEIFSALDPTFFEKVLISILGGLIGAGGALLVYYLKVQSDKHTDEEKSKRHLYNKLSYFNSLLSSVIDSTQEQIGLNRQYCLELKEKPFEFVHFNISVSDNLKRICEVIDQEYVYHSFLEFLDTSESSKEILKVLNNCDYIHTALKLIIEKNRLAGLKIENVSMEYSVLSEKVMDDAAAEMNNIKRTSPEYNQDPYWKFINNSLLNYYSKIPDERTIPLREEFFIKPFKLGLVHEFDRQENSDKLSTMCKGCTHKFTYLIKLSTDLSDEIVHDTNEIEKTLPILEKINKRIINSL